MSEKHLTIKRDIIVNTQQTNKLVIEAFKKLHIGEKRERTKNKKRENKIERRLDKKSLKNQIITRNIERSEKWGAIE